MIRRITLIASLAAVSTLTMVSQASAGTGVVPFNGSITANPTCTFSNIVGGTLTNTGTNEWVEGSQGIPGLSAGGNAGSATVTCSTSGSLTTSVPVKVSAPSAFVPEIEQAIVYDGTNYTTNSTGAKFDNGAWDKPTTPIAITNSTPVNLKVGMIAGKRAFDASVPTGTYTYNVTLTATPN